MISRLPLWLRITLGVLLALVALGLVVAFMRGLHTVAGLGLAGLFAALFGAHKVRQVDVAAQANAERAVVERAAADVMARAAEDARAAEAVGGAAEAEDLRRTLRGEK